MDDRRQLDLAPEHEPPQTLPPPPPPPSSMLGELPLAALKPVVDPLSDRKLGAEAGVALAPDIVRGDVPKPKSEAKAKAKAEAKAKAKTKGKARLSPRPS